MRPDTPQFEIAPVLEELGFDSVPRVTAGYAKVRCAFHGERTPSASISRYGFRCFACDRQGDAIKLVREERGLSFADAVSFCEDVTGGGDRRVEQSGRRAGGLLQI